jgi:metallophosphoesterase (TIGR00282 family)
MFRVLFFGDVIGEIGRNALAIALPDLKKELSPDFIIANVENLSHGRGISAKSLGEMDALGIDGYTSGNHVWNNIQGLACFEDPRWKDRIVRPANVPPTRAGRGTMTLEKNGKKLVVTNFLGRLFMHESDEASSPFLAFDRIATEHADLPILVDLHTETTSEKEAFGHHADGRAAAVFGTHTHVPTADEKILPGGTAYITDVGRNGAMDSVVGFEKTSALGRFLDPNTKTYEIPKSGTAEINAVLVTIDETTRRATALDRIRRFVAVS